MRGSVRVGMETVGEEWMLGGGGNARRLGSLPGEQADRAGHGRYWTILTEGLRSQGVSSYQKRLLEINGVFAKKVVE